jgi:predicted O-methyltransferase YrrM
MKIYCKKYLSPITWTRFLKRVCNKLRGDIFSNPGPITDQDFEQIRMGINEVKPKLFIEVGTGGGVSTRKIYKYLRRNYSDCHFYTIEIFRKYYENVRKDFSHCSTFHAFVGLSVNREEATFPAYGELINYSGPADILRNLFKNEIKGKRVDIAFIDSRKGTALAEFSILEKNLSSKGIIFCHDILNNGKGVEVLEYIKKDEDKYSFEVIDTGAAGMIKIRLKDK